MNPAKNKVLFVDDEPNILSALWRTFRKDGLEIHLAHNAEDALRKLEKSPVNLVVSDYRMPGMNGLELLEIVRKHWPETKGLILSAYDDYPRILRQSRKMSKLYPFLSKPWEEQILRSMVMKLLEQSGHEDSIKKNLAKAA